MSEEKDQPDSIISGIQETSRKFSHSISKMQRRFKQLIAPVLVQQERFQEFFNSTVKPALEKLGPALERLQTFIDELPPHIRATLQILGDKGWYADLSMPLLSTGQKLNAEAKVFMLER